MSDRDTILGVDIGGTKILVGLVDLHGNVIERQRYHTRPDHLLPDTLMACADMIEAARLGGRTVGGIGIGAKGVVDRNARALVSSLYLGHAHVPLGAELEAAFGLPVRVENDVHAATIGEQIFGIGREIEDFLFFNAGTGIAVGIVVGGELYRGASNTAGENGHVVMDRSGQWPCACGLSGCMETMIVAGRQGAVLPRILIDPGQMKTDVTGKPASDQRHPASATMDDCPADPAYGYLLTSILDLIEIFDPAAIVLTGGMLANNPQASAWISSTAGHHLAGRDSPTPIPIIPAFGGADAGLIGAAALLLRTSREVKVGPRKVVVAPS